MVTVKFSQTVFGGSLRIIGNISSVQLFSKSGTATEKDTYLYVQDDTPDYSTSRRLQGNNIFSKPEEIASISESLIASINNIIDDSFQVMIDLKQQSEYVKILNDGNEKTDNRQWNTARLTFFHDPTHFLNQDLLLGSSKQEIVNQYTVALDNLFRQKKDLEKQSNTINKSTGTVLFAPGAGGIFIHEIFGHMLEGDFISNGFSLVGRSIHPGDKIGPEFLTIIDDPSEYSKYTGCGKIDDEGEPISRIELVKRGILKHYLCDIDAAKKTGNYGITGCARRQSYLHRAIPRMRATYVLPRDSGGSLDELISNTRSGFLASQVISGNLNHLSGDFTLQCGQGYIIERGRTTIPVYGARLSGNIVSALRSIEEVGDDLLVMPSQCMKAGQMIPVCVGSPSLKVSNICIEG